MHAAHTIQNSMHILQVNMKVTTVTQNSTKSVKNTITRPSLSYERAETGSY